ncbi:MAG: non-ribosomal peptide synthetase, partial [Candidatus Omnitrophota bacterium]
DRLFFTFDYCTKLFVSKTIDRFISYFKRLMGQVLENPDQKLSQMEIIGEEEKGLILNEFNDTRADYPRGKTIHDLFEEQAVKTPDQLALLGPTSVGMFREAPLQISYRELNEQSNHLSWILKEVGIEPDTIVAIKIERSIEMIIGILGILKSGGAYLPIDPDYPQDRIDYILKDSGVTVLVTTSNEEVEKLRTREGKTVLFLDSLNLSSSHPLNFSTIFSPLPAAGNRPPDASLAYVIYTSGSTGKPKGAVVEMKGFVNLLHWYIGELNLTETDNVLLIAPVSFDLAQKNLFASLIMGGRLTLGRPGILNYNELSESVCKGNVTIVNCAPSVFYPLIEFNFDQEFVKLQSLRVVVLGGEPILTDKLWPWVNAEGYHCEIFNTYGPTECTDIATFHRTHREFMAERGAIPIGKCIPNVKVFILDKYYHIQPIRVSGEIVIGGIGVSQGYLNRPELTSDKFIGYRLPVGRLLNLSPINRFCPAFYHTGDLGRWLEDGNIEFLGRIDHQVKIRGFRIEMGEIESRLLSMPGVKDAVVLANDDDRGDKYLCAYLVSDRKLEISEMREFLARLLPAYMVPAYFLELEKIPLSPNGKVDRKALPKPGIAIGQNYVAPRNETEEKLVELWSTILNIEKDVISIDSNFFELGGHSLKATILLTRIEKMFDVKIPLSEVFNTPTIQCLSSCISAFHAIRIQPSNSISEKKEELFL